MSTALETAEFGTLLRRLRQAAGLTQEALAERAGLGTRSIQDLERGVARPRADTTRRLAAALALRGEEQARFIALAQPPPRGPRLRLASPPATTSTPRWTAEGWPAGLPVALTSFVGRAREIAQIENLLTTTRLLTLTGTGGVGKTRLAQEVAAGLSHSYPDGVHWAELAALADPALVPAAVAAALDVREAPGQSILATLLAALKGKRLLVLDNCEHLIEACAHLADALLRGCPGLVILATSREALGVAGEVAWHVPSLPVPAPDRLPPLEEVAEGEAVALFVQRAAAARPGFALTAENAGSVVEICRRLDGIPLALELAAARLNVLAVEQIAQRLDDRFRLLTAGSRTALPRQQTLRAAVNWSHDLLSGLERVLFRRLAVFAGGWTLEAAEAVCSDQGVGGGDQGSRNVMAPANAPPDGPDPCPQIPESSVLDLLARLADKSLVLVEEAAGEARYRLLETIRQYARERLHPEGTRSGEAEELQRRHADYYHRFAEEAAPMLGAADQATWLARLEAAHDNLRAALGWCLAHDASTGLRLAAALWRFWLLRGYWSEGRGWLEALLRRGGAAAPARVRAQALSGAGHLATHQGDADAARALLLESVATWREVGDRRGLADALHWLGREYASPEAEDRLRESLALYRALNDERGIAEVLGSLGEHLREQGDVAAGRALGEESLARWRALGDTFNVAFQLYRLGHIARHAGEYARARALYDESLVLNRELGHRWGIAMSLVNLGFVEGRDGNPARAAALARESLLLNRELGNKWGMCRGFHLLAAAAVSAQRPEETARLLGVAETLRLSAGMTWQPYDRAEHDQWMDSARAALGEPAFSAAWAAGRQMTLEQAIAYALEDADRP